MILILTYMQYLPNDANLRIVIFIFMSKKEILISGLSLFLFCNSPAFSQTTIDLIHNSKRTGDIVEMYKILTDNIWDLTSSDKQGYAVYEKNEDFKEDTITVLFNGTRKYYEYHCDSLLYVTLENPQNIESFYLPEVSCIFPMKLGDNYSGLLASHISYCDKLILHKFGEYTIHADSIGTLTLRNGNTVENALQLSYRRKYVYEQLDSCNIDSLPQYTEAAILGKLSTEKEVYSEVEKDIYIKGYRYPIVKDIILYNAEGDPFLSETYYSLPEEQEFLVLDEPNLEARREKSGNDYSESPNKLVNIFSYISNRPGSMEVVFDIENYLVANPQNGTVQCRLLLSDNRGIVYRTKNYNVNSNSQQFSLSYSGLRHGQYVLSVVINNQIYTNNFIVD